MTIAHLTTVHLADDNRITLKEATSLMESGLDVVLLARGPRSKASPVRHVALDVHGGRLMRLPTGYRSAWRALRKERPSLLHLHDPELIPLGVAYRFIHRIPVVYDAHEDLPAQVVGKEYIPSAIRRVVRWFAMALEGLADVALSAVVIAEPALRARYPRNARVVLVQNFPWQREFPRVAPADDRSATIGYIGAISVPRGIREMCAVASKSVHGPRLLLAGGIASDEAQNAIDSCSQADYHGRVPADQIPSLLSSVNIGMCILHPLPNYVEAQSTKIFEYMAAGRPFIYSNFPAWVKMFGTEGGGIPVDPHDVDAIVAAVDSILSDPAKAVEMGLAGRSSLERSYTFESEAPKLVSLVRELVQ